MRIESVFFTFMLVLCCWPVCVQAETPCVIHAQWEYPSSETRVVGFMLYQEGRATCQAPLALARSLDCTVYLPDTGTTYFTLTALMNNGVESMHSSPFFFGINQTQGFDPEYYLSVKLAALQNDPETASDWIGQDKVELLQVLRQYGFTPELHYSQYGYGEGLAPNRYFNAAEYMHAKAKASVHAGTYPSISAAMAAFQNAWTGNPYLHYLAYGDEEGINPSNSFDVSAYLEAQLAALQANPATAAQYQTVTDVRARLRADGLTTLGHFLQFGIHEGLVAFPVPAAERVTP